MKLKKNIRYCFLVKNEKELNFLFSIFKKQKEMTIDVFNDVYTRFKTHLKKYEIILVYHYYETDLTITYDNYNSVKNPLVRYGKLYNKYHVGDLILKEKIKIIRNET